MVLMSAVTPAPDEGSKPAIVRTTGGVGAIDEMYRKAGANRTIFGEERIDELPDAVTN